MKGLENSWLLRGDCLDVMRELPDNYVDAVICDPPYGTTSCNWDSVIPLVPMWNELRRVARSKNTPFVLFGCLPFTAALVASNLREFRHSWNWNKKAAANIGNAKHGPLKVTEDVLVFGQKRVNYYPQMIKGKGRWKGGKKKKSDIYVGDFSDRYWSNTYYPKSLLEYSNAARSGRLHPTQKPVELMAQLIKTYTKEGEVVLDFTMGSGTTGVACKQENRKFIGIEQDAAYFEIARERIAQT